MTHQEFSELVSKFALPIPWLALHVGHVSERTFRYWVSGRPGTEISVPHDAVERMSRLNRAIEQALRQDTPL